jgi:CRISPR-associated protein Cmx8
MLWAIPRGNPQSRIPFEQRAEGKDCKEGQEAWADLVKAEQARKKNAFHTGEVAGSLWLGAQAANAEAIPFVGRVEQNLLLHFWPLTALVFVPQQITDEGESEFVGYVLAIPEVADLENFLMDYPQMLEQVGGGVRGYRPAEAIIDLPAQGALAFLSHLARLAAHTAEREKFRYAVASVEYLHLAKVGNNIKSLAAGRVAPSTELVEEYRLIAGTKDRPPSYRNPLFRRGLLLALLKQLEWHQPMAPLLVEKPWPLFIRSEESPRQLPWFWQDAAEKFQQLTHAYEVTREREVEMLRDSPETGGGGTPTPLALLIHRLVQNYVNRRTEEKSGLKWEDFKDRKVKDEKTGKERTEVPVAYCEAREKVASGTFLEMRSRRGQAFVDHFTATFCSIKQFLPEDEFQVVAVALINEHENVKTYTLLALSANS